MGLYHIDLDGLSKYYDIPVPELKERKFAELECMMDGMRKEKRQAENEKNAKDPEYTRLVRKFFRPFGYLSQWFSAEDIIMACAATDVDECRLCGEVFVEPGRGCFMNDAEYIRTSVEYVPKYDRHGREYMERERKKVDVFRTHGRYQGLCHGPVIKYLLYGRYPDLAQFEFEMYEMYAEERYEIYPRCGIYVPFTALMSGDVEAIKKRNREYCASYNYGAYAPDPCEERLASEEAEKLFNVVRSIGEKERQRAAE